MMEVTVPAGRRLTPDQVGKINFQPARLGRRGLDEGQVRAFCAQVEDELALLADEKARWAQEAERLRQRILSGSQDDAPGAGLRPGEAHVQAVHVLARAQQTADRYVSDAQEYCRELAEDARHHRNEIISEARANAAKVLTQAHTQASKAAAAVPTPGAPMSAAERQALEAELAYLRTFSDVCRTHLRAYLEALARNVEEWERAEQTSLAALRPGTAAHPVTMQEEQST